MQPYDGGCKMVKDSCPGLRPVVVEGSRLRLAKGFNAAELPTLQCLFRLEMKYATTKSNRLVMSSLH